MEKQKRMVLLDWIKAVAILCVIITHTDLYGRGIPINYMLNCLVVAMAVPVFMMISGYNMANSYIVNRRDAGGGYSIASLKRQILRIIPSYTLIYLMEIVFLFLNGETQNLGWKHIILFYIIGGKGPGGYYVPIMIQLFLIMPFLVSFVCKCPAKGLFSVFIVNLLFELLVKLVLFHPEIYRLFIGRYLFLLAMGVFLRTIKGKKLPMGYLSISFAIGILYICVTNHFRLPDPNGLYSWSFFKYWQMTAFPVAFYLFPFMYLLLDKLSGVQVKTWFGSIMQKIGSRTWYIYGVQMFYFLIVYEVYGVKYDLQKIPLLFELFANFFLCISGGFLLYHLENWGRRILAAHLKR